MHTYIYIYIYIYPASANLERSCILKKKTAGLSECV